MLVNMSYKNKNKHHDRKCLLKYLHQKVCLSFLLDLVKNKMPEVFLRQCRQKMTVNVDTFLPTGYSPVFTGAFTALSVPSGPASSIFYCRHSSTFDFVLCKCPFPCVLLLCS